ncbi:DUF4209 domain-containing protein [Halococcus sp. IIIV-5B]|uniref:DUF4209 domain-containing protein n=1 Tax=Halococcus sp. IIIV-5B TaxID=2321230 RepID=UPI000E73A409|nr:DUF4209 domain-containing protein [Halococcus sp. IIIV-5B]RJT04894.1 DUF4209 domain-containing protein [Halococcus sp. IIIV-5B]
MGRLQHSLDNARNNPEKDFHLALELDRIFSELEQGEEINEDIDEEIAQIDDNINIFEIYNLVRKWRIDGEFQAVQDVLPLLQDGIDQALSDEWYNIVAEYHYLTINLKYGMSGHDADEEVKDTLSYLLDNRKNVSSSRVIRIIDLIRGNLGDVSDERKDEWVRLVEDGIEDSRSSNDFDTERSYLRKLHSLKINYGEDTKSIESDLIDTYRKEADWQEERSSLIKADVLRSGINEFGQYMGEEQEERWKKEALEARKKGTEEEMVEMDLENLPNVEYDGDIMEDIYDEMDRNRDFIVESFKNLKYKYNSTCALYHIIVSEALIPDVTRMRLNSEQFVLQNMISRKIISPEYNTLSTNPMDNTEDIPNNYGRKALSLMDPAASAFYQLIKEGHLTIRDFIVMLRVSNSLSSDKEAFLTEALCDLFDGNYIQSLFVALPHIEGAIVDSLGAVDRTAYTNMEHGTQQQNLGGLFRMDDYFDEDYSTYLRWRYTSREGMNLRNRAAHGQLRYANAHYYNAILTMCDIIRVIMKINSSAFLRAFGPPETTLRAKATNYGEETDLSLYTDLNRRIVGYGESNDRHSFVVIRNHGNEDVIELFVERGKISRYKIGHFGLSEEEIRSRINLLGSEYIEIPSDVEYTWLTDEKIMDDLLWIINDLSNGESDEVQKESVFERARTVGIDESTARMAFHELEDGGSIKQSEDAVSSID